MTKFKLTKTISLTFLTEMKFYYLVKFKLTKTNTVKHYTTYLFYYLVKFKLTKTSNSFLPKFEGAVAFFNSSHKKC